MASVGEVRNGYKIVPIRQTLERLSYPQPLTPIKTDISTAPAIANKTIV